VTPDFVEVDTVRADRLISILMLLQTCERMTAHDLAQRLEVSERTIYRDLDVLSMALFLDYPNFLVNTSYSLQNIQVLLYFIEQASKPKKLSIVAFSKEEG